LDKQTLSYYFDYNATTPISESVTNTMKSNLSLFYNPSSNSTLAGESKEVIHRARRNVAKLLGCEPAQVFFVSGGSEANNWAIKGYLLNLYKNPGHIITSAIEHPSVLESLKYLEKQFNFQVTYIEPQANGAISAQDVGRAFNPRTQFISLMYANNETGVIQPVEFIQKLLHSGVKFHIDGVQYIGKCPTDVKSLNVDFMSFSAHKFYGPKGIGGLFVKDPKALSPLIHGGGQEMGMRAGTENMLAISGIGQAADDCNNWMDSWYKHYVDCKNYLIKRLQELPFKIDFNGDIDTTKSVPNTLNFSIDGVRGEAVAAFLDKKYNIAVSVGSACSNNKQNKLSHVLVAMGLDEERVQSALRVSFGRYTTFKDIDYFVDGLTFSVTKLQNIGAIA